MAKGFIGATGYKAYLGATKMKAGYIGATRVYSAGSTVTYVVDNGVSYTEEIDSGASCLSPKTFTPAKSGWTFAGWRQDTSPNGNVLTNLVMEDGPITLYAVFAKSVTVSYYNESTGVIKDVKNRYYNVGSITNPSFTLYQTAKNGWTPAGWAVADGSVAYSNGTAFTRDSDITLYGKYNQTITVTYYNGTTSPTSATGTRSYYSGTGAIVNPTFTLYQVTMSGWATQGWSASTAGNGEISYNNGAAFTRDSNITLYGMYGQSITLSYNGNGATGGSNVAQIGTRYYNSGTGATVNPSFTLSASGFVRTNYAFAKWALNSGSGTQYAVGAAITLSANATMYAVWVQNAQEFNYTGGMQSYTVPATGIYQLLAYGAEGGKSNKYAGGKGGYAVGYATLTAGQVLYICVGGAGAAASKNSVPGGYNGGGASGVNGEYYGGGSGGGATHIGTARNDRLVTYGGTNNTGLYIVAGGGGGAGAEKGAGGAGGGASGENGGNSTGVEYGRGGTQDSSPGSSYTTAGSYGAGGSGYWTQNGGYGGGGGGGGLYGGGGGGPFNGGAAGGGGSGYIGGVPAFTYGGVTYSPGMLNGQWSGNGYAKITFICAI